MKKLVKILSVMLVSAMMTHSAYAHDHMEDKTQMEKLQKTGPAQLGDHIPADLSASDQQGKLRNFDDLHGDSGLILVFSRSLDWCPYCQKQAVDINGKRAAFEDQGYKIAMVTYDEPHKSKSFSDRHDIRYPVLSDHDSAIIKAFGLLNTEYKQGTKYYGVPHPAIFVISPDGLIKARYEEKGYKKRPDLKVILQDLQN